MAMLALGFGVAAANANPARGLTVPEVHPLRPLSLRMVDRCFYAPSAAVLWPLAPLQHTHPVRSGFDDPRAGRNAHSGVDVEATNGQSVYAVTFGLIHLVVNRGAFEEHFAIDAVPSGIYYTYWHATLLETLRVGSVVRAGELIGHVIRPAGHVHLSESFASSFDTAWKPCRWVDARRPTGILHDLHDTEAPTIGPLLAFSAVHPAEKLDLADLHGKVDFRAVVSDHPIHHTRLKPQMQLAPAVVGSYLTPAANTLFVYGHRTISFDGARLILPSRYPLVYAPGTIWDSACFYSAHEPCHIKEVFHAHAAGMKTRRYPNGHYQVCVFARTINAVAARRCTKVTLKNP
jgi:hypothetical protein